MENFKILTQILFVFCLGFYLITSLQWFSYKIERVIFHFTKPKWHLFYLILPLIFYYFFMFLDDKNENFWWLFAGFFYFVYLPFLVLFNHKLDKKLVFTMRVKRFFLFLAIFSLLCIFSKNFVILSLILALIFSQICEKIVGFYYFKKAQNKIKKNKNLTIICITASFGKTSIKNFLFDILKNSFKCYKTPRSVNTLQGLIKDINENLSQDCEIYIAEAGARKNGDILEIAKFLNPQICIVGEIGKQHIEYFKTIQNIRQTKLELLQSSRLKKAFLHSTTEYKDENFYDKNFEILKSDLEGIEFLYEKEKFHTKILGDFNVENLCACIKVAKFLGLDYNKIKTEISNIKSVEHRLQKIENAGKIIIDDSFNGNLKGMLKSYELVKTYNFRKVIITPGIVESSNEDNQKLAKKINEIFDLVIITGELNLEIFKENIDKEKIYILSDKSKMVEVLAKITRPKDLIIFSNDAPNFI